jgi:hypothetical protein
VLAAIILPATAISSVYGMNVIVNPRARCPTFLIAPDRGREAAGSAATHAIRQFGCLACPSGWFARATQVGDEADRCAVILRIIATHAICRGMFASWLPSP